MDTRQIRLTETVKKGGCAAKLPAGELKKALGGLKLLKPKELIVGLETLDDGCLWDLGDDRYLIQTLDFFTPIVDDPIDFGAIAAANALSDVYAMGGSPKTALSILAFPATQLPIEILSELMRGAIEKIEEAGACLAGGHTIDDETLKFGFSVSGFVPKSKVWTNAGSKPGDVLILTKGLGTGTITTALKVKEAPEESISAAIDSMKTLNRVPELLGDVTVNAATDITGFGLAGHALQMAKASGVHFKISAQMLPEIKGARNCIKNEMLNRAHATNEKYVQNEVSFEADVDPCDRMLTFDPQTSGGILLSIPENDSELALQEIKKKFPAVTIIGRVTKAGSGSVGSGAVVSVYRKL